MADWVEEIQKRLDARTPGEWQIAYGDDETGDKIFVFDDPSQIDEYPSYTDIAEEMLSVDSRFIAKAPTDIAKLIAAVKVATKALMLTQHSGVDDLIGFVCPMCWEAQENGHMKGCAIGDALAQLQSGEFGERNDENASVD